VYFFLVLENGVFRGAVCSLRLLVADDIARGRLWFLLGDLLYHGAHGWLASWLRGY
jgi:hypothetical protein